MAGETDYWALGINGILNAAGSGLLGGDLKKLTNPRPNPPTAVSQPAAAPPPAPVAGQQGTNPAAGPAPSFLQQHWVLLAVGALVVVVGAVYLARRK